MSRGKPTVGSAIDWLNGGYIDQILVDSASGALTGQDFGLLYVASPTVFTALNDGTNNLLTKYNLTGKTVPAGVLIAGVDGRTITQVTISSGQLMAYKARVY